MTTKISELELYDRFRLNVKRGMFGAAAQVQREIRALDVEMSAASAKEIPLLNWSQTNSFEEVSYLFISGTPRSGTSALGGLFRGHPDVALYTELFSPASGYVPEMFNNDNIIKYYAAGLLPSLDRFQNRKVLQKSRHVQFLGDKRPNFMRSHGLTMENFRRKKVIVIHIYRKINDIVASYLVRARNGTWSASRDHNVAVAEANMNNNYIIEALRQEHDEMHTLILLDYDTLWSDSQHWYALLTKSGISSGMVNNALVDNAYRRAAEIRSQVKEPLDPNILRYIYNNYNHECDDLVRRTFTNPDLISSS